MRSRATQFLLSALLLFLSFPASAHLTPPSLPDFLSSRSSTLPTAVAAPATLADVVDRAWTHDDADIFQVIVLVFSDDPEREYVGIVGRNENGAIWILYEGKLPLGLFFMPGVSYLLDAADDAAANTGNETVATAVGALTFYGRLACPDLLRRNVDAAVTVKEEGVGGFVRQEVAGLQEGAGSNNWARAITGHEPTGDSLDKYGKGRRFWEGTQGAAKLFLALYGGVKAAQSQSHRFADGSMWRRNVRSFFKKAPRSETQSLYRAVRPGELDDLTTTNQFRNPAGVENKYFSTTEGGARQYGDMAQRAFKDGPYTVVETSIPKSQIIPEMSVTVDSGIPTVTVPTNKLPSLAPPVLPK